MDKKEIALSIVGIAATIIVGYLFYQMSQRDMAANAAATANAAANAVDQQYAQQTYLQSLPSISVATPSTSTTDTSNDTAASNASFTPALDPSLESILAAFIGNSNNLAATDTGQPLIPIYNPPAQSNAVNGGTTVQIPQLNPIATSTYASTSAPVGTAISSGNKLMLDTSTPTTTSNYPRLTATPQNGGTVTL